VHSGRYMKSATFALCNAIMSEIIQNTTKVTIVPNLSIGPKIVDLKS